MKKNKLLLILLALVAFGPTAWAQDLIINSASDWHTFAENVNGGNSYSGKTVKLTADITVSEMVGTDANRFSGIFIGDGHTLTANIGTSDSRFSEAKCGPFRYINGATFKRLHVAGTIYTSNQNAGMVGEAEGTNYFQSCHCSLTINSNKSGDGTHGGFIGLNNGSSNFTNCLFDGSFVSTNTTAWGGFIGWINSSASLTNCLFAPTGISLTDDGKTFARSYDYTAPTLTNCYYKQVINVAQGNNASSMSNEQLLAALGSAWQISGEKVVPIMQLQALTGSGTTESPYLIASADNWNDLAFNVNIMGESYSGQYFKMTANIEVSEMIGTNDNRFSGTFNGDGHTLTFNKGTADNRFGEQYCAPFRYINGATFKRLHVTGTIYMDKKFAAGVAGGASGNNYFQSCRSSMTINSSVNGDGTHGGFIANNNQTSYLTNCLFDGSFVSTTTYAWGGFVGWTGLGYTYFTNCLFAPTGISSTNDSKTFARSYNDYTPSVTNCYYKQNLGGTLGTDASSMSNAYLLSALGGMWEISGNAVIPIIHPYSLTLAGSGTANDPYLITSLSDWNAFAAYVNSGIDFSESYFKLTADITVSEMAGTDANRFNGIFNGDGHTLTFNKGTSGSYFNEQYCAPFRFINNATIKRLHVAGAIYTSNQFAGMVGHAKGTNYIQSCHCSLTINSSIISNNPDGTHGGFIANNNQTSYLTNCLFDGSFISTNTTNCGGFIGWTGSGHAYFTNCLFDPTNIDFTNASTCKTFARYNNSNADYSKCYYKQTFGTVDGGTTNASSMTNDELVAALGSAWQISGEKVVPVIQKQTLTGSGIEGDPYLIASTADWNKLAYNVTFCDESYSGQYFKLTDNITISATIGSESFPFGGIFDGDGHILNLNISDYSISGTAPFRYISDATIKDVKTTGVVIGGKHCSGLVGFATGTTNLIQGCEVAAEVYCCGSNKTHCGGILGHGKSSNTTIQDCLFAGTIEGATTMTGIIFGWGDASNHTIINCLSSGDCVGGTVKLIAGNGTQTITNCYHSTAGPTDGTDASSMSRDDLQTALGGGWGTRGSHVVPVRFAETATPQEGVAMVDLESDYVPTQIINGNFGVEPWVSYRIGETTYTASGQWNASNKTIDEAFPNGINGGWNTSETVTFFGGLFEYTASAYNNNIPTLGNCIEMNANNSAVLSQDLTTHEHDVIRWSLLHAVRTGYGDEVQSMQVEVGSPIYNGNNIVAATGINNAVNSKITDASKAVYTASGYTGTYAQGGDNLAKLSLNKNVVEDNSSWHTIRGIYMIPDGQTVTRFAFIATNPGELKDAGNYLDNLIFSTLIGNLSAVQLDNGDVLLRGYWGETDASKRLVVATNSKTGSNTYYDMSSVANENFKITIPAASLGASSSLSVYHEDYPDAERTITISYYKVITKYTSDESGWHFISSPIGTVEPGNVAHMTENTYDIYRFNQNPAITTVEGVDKYLEWENWKRPNEGEGGINHFHFNLEPGRGYLYANSEDVTLIFTGTPYNGNGVVTLDYSEGNPARNMWGWNLVGNPFPVAAYVDRPFYKMNDAGTGIVPVVNDFNSYTPTTIPSCTGIMVQTTAAEVALRTNKVIFSTTAPAQQATNNGNLQIALSQSNTRGNALLDNAIVSFNEGNKLGKFYFGEQDANIYIPKGTEEYAIAYSNGQGEMPLNFKANANGEYTITVNPENVEMAYLHLIDNMTGADIDLLQTPEYTFTAKTTDYESRFRLVFICTDANDDNGSDNDNFAFFSNGQLIVNNSGEATLQVIDLTGRILSSETINGSVSKSINQPAGVYMLRLINGNDVKVQKMVVR